MTGEEAKNNYKAFAEWVAGEVIDEELWECNSGGFPEVACRKLNKLGVVNTDGKRWIYGNEVLECETKTGQWIEVIEEIDSFGNKTWHHECSICGNTDSGWGQYKYCPNCGCRMENK